MAIRGWHSAGVGSADLPCRSAAFTIGRKPSPGETSTRELDFRSAADADVCASPWVSALTADSGYTGSPAAGVVKDAPGSVFTCRRHREALLVRGR